MTQVTELPPYTDQPMVIGHAVAMSEAYQKQIVDDLFRKYYYLINPLYVEWLYRNTRR